MSTIRIIQELPERGDSWLVDVADEHIKGRFIVDAYAYAEPHVWQPQMQDAPLPREDMEWLAVKVWAMVKASDAERLPTPPTPKPVVRKMPLPSDKPVLKPVAKPMPKPVPKPPPPKLVRKPLS